MGIVLAARRRINVASPPRREDSLPAANYGPSYEHFPVAPRGTSTEALGSPIFIPSLNPIYTLEVRGYTNYALGQNLLLTRRTAEETQDEDLTERRRRLSGVKPCSCSDQRTALACVAESEVPSISMYARAIEGEWGSHFCFDVRPLRMLL